MSPVTAPHESHGLSSALDATARVRLVLDWNPGIRCVKSGNADKRDAAPFTLRWSMPEGRLVYSRASNIASVADGVQPARQRI